ncbi:MAG: hypothetical protein A2887_06370 [Alphaproteobacteria bacterium RIFCSPLOWO2_01_FULL_40_26]|nr:MAG: hypothetical protein A3D15_00435 [Alphaproteobacteria bacterium RIFCSPHIGHO2_02_FULL_40_34]OFW94546.1 MAG: hypothetical protein A2887_06370 [Alphaproteobacteria bacterium RIFCSPLOWO2_01_FULL_40_26]OFX10295.1 MAG: hypothetical protein A3H30_01070 [Alphaproteobacteria bacterium RIFCSPLOWO2_02_FULL_40_19]OFX11896.1 MAG: hypothetical protein A3G22_03815 [Alphaproteobacteria bacterium RIFCSPLOWO2_12_FULL_40_11]
MPAKIEIKSRQTDYNNFLPSDPNHMYIVYTNEAGESRVLRGNPKNETLFGALFDDILIVDTNYDETSPDWDSSGTHPHQPIFTGTDSEMYSLISLAITEMNRINSQGYDYNLPIFETLLPNTPWAELNNQNSNSSAMALAKVMGFENQILRFIYINNLNVPGYDSPIEHSVFEKSVDSLFSAISSSSQSISNFLNVAANLLGISIINEKDFALELLTKEFLSANPQFNGLKLKLNLVESSHLQSFLQTYHLNSNLSDFAGIIPSVIINDGNGGNFNLTALPDFSNLIGEEQDSVWNNFTNQFLESALSSFNYDIDQFTNFLNQNRISFFQFNSDLTSSLGADGDDEGIFSPSFDSYFNQSILKNLNLDKNLFKLKTTITDGEAKTSGEIGYEEVSYNEPDFTQRQTTTTQTIAIPADQIGNAIYYLESQDYKNIEEFENDQLNLQQEYDRITRWMVDDLKIEQGQFIERFNEDLQNFIQENSQDWQEKFSDFSHNYDLEWKDLTRNAISNWHADVEALLDEYEGITYYNPETYQISDITGTLKSGLGGDWDFDPWNEDGEILAHGYWEIAQDFEIVGEFEDYWRWFDSNSDGFISQEEFYEDWNKFITYLEDNGYYERLEAFDYSELSYNGPEYFEQFDDNGDGLINEYEFDYGGEDDYREWALWDSSDGYWADYNPYDEINWQEALIMADWSPYESIEEAFDVVHSVNFSERWVYVDEDYVASDYWDIEAEVSFETTSPDYSELHFSNFISANSWELEISTEWKPSDIAFDVNFDANFNFDVEAINRAFEQFAYDFLYQPLVDYRDYDTAKFENASYSLVESDNAVISGGVANEIIISKAISLQVDAGDGLDIVNGSEGADEIDGGNGDDILIGNGGNDVLRGGEGNDLFVFDSSNDGASQVIDSDGAIIIDEKRLAGIAIQDGNSDRFMLGAKTLQMIENDLLVSYGTNNSILIKNFEDKKFGITLNRNPESNLEHVEIDEDNAVIFDVLASVSDVDNDQLNLAAINQPENGKAEIIDGKIKYTPNSNWHGSDSLRYLISDGRGGFLEKTLSIAVNSVNDALAIDYSIGNLSAKTTQQFIFKLPADLISDIDSDAQIQIKKADGSDLPSWLSFNSETKELRGTPPSSAYGLQNFILIVSDAEYEVRKNFGLVVDSDLTLKSGANLITANENNDPISSSEGNKADLVIGDERDNVLEFKSDGNWSKPSYWAWNPYTNDWVRIFTKIRSFDAFDGKGGYDILNLTDGHDTIFLDDQYSQNGSQSGARLANIEEINGSDGDDIIDLSSRKYTYNDITLNGNDGNDVLWSNDGNDIINGGAGNDHIVGGRGDDILNGDEGNDIIKGHDGNDTIDGGKDNDKITGGLGADILSGGIGNDVFIYENIADSTRDNTDLILDFIQNQDKIDLSQIAEINSLDDLNIIFQNNQTLIEAQDHDFQIKLNQQIQLTEQDFLFS